MKTLVTYIIFTLLIVEAISAQQYDLYYYSYDTDLVKTHQPKKIEVALSVPIGVDFAVQGAYSPIKHLSLSAGFNHKPSYEGNSSASVGKESYNFAIGTYLNLKEKRTRAPSYEQRKAYSLTVSLEVGYGIHNLATNSGVQFPSQYSTDISYESVFANVAIGYEYKFGKIFTSLSYRRIYINSASFSGSFPDSDRLFSMISQLEERTEYDIVNLGFHNRVGKKAVKLLTGVNVPIYYFYDFKNNAASISNSGNLYLGAAFDIGALVDKFSNKKE
ncbi:MAG: hypothetical protein AB8F74_17450 [Saprospiraceae bacterium]